MRVGRPGDWVAASEPFFADEYRGGTLPEGPHVNESLTFLKAAVSCRGLCAPHVLPPLRQFPTPTHLAARPDVPIATAQRKIMKTRPILGLTMGDPAGIGPELCLRALREPAVLRRCTPVLFGDAGVLQRLEKLLGKSSSSSSSSSSSKSRHQSRTRTIEGRERELPCAFTGRMGKTGAVARPLIVDCAAIDARKSSPGKFRRPAAGRDLFSSNRRSGRRWRRRLTGW